LVQQLDLNMFPGVAVITGAAGTGMGAAIAKSFAQEGCNKIAITDLNNDLLEATRQAITEKHPDVEVLAVTGNIADEGFVESFFEQVISELGRIDYCVNCAGVMGNNKSSTETSTADFDRINSINYRGCWLTSRAELKHMLTQEPLESHDGRPGERGSIVNIASQLGLVGRPNARECPGTHRMSRR
jgi:NAD(P)-dependent dehydrogenase (short-subunit alcohol dehydrogenase family)